MLDADSDNGVLDFPFRVLNPNKHRESREKRWLDAKLKEARTNPVSDIHPLTPELAGLLLQANPDNRNIKSTNVAACVADIISGRWQFNGESIVISKDGLLNDGQHRCAAVIETATTIPHQLFCFGVERETRTTVDSGSARTAGDYLGMEGVNEANHRASVASMLIQIETHGRPVTTGVLKPTKQEVIERCRADAPIGDSIRKVNKPLARRLASVTVLAACHYLLSVADRDAADEFMQQVITGESLTAKHPVLRLRNKLLDPNLRLNKTEQINAIIRTWNFVRQGKTAIGAGSLTHTLPKGQKLPRII